jgi:hypothetical protein
MQTLLSFTVLMNNVYQSDDILRRGLGKHTMSKVEDMSPRRSSPL